MQWWTSTFNITSGVCTQSFDSCFIHGRHADSIWVCGWELFNWDLLYKVTCVCWVSEDSHVTALQTCGTAKKFISILFINCFVYFSNEQEGKPFIRLACIYSFQSVKPSNLFCHSCQEPYTDWQEWLCSEEFSPAYTCCVEFLKEMLQQTDFLLGFFINYWNKTWWYFSICS